MTSPPTMRRAKSASRERLCRPSRLVARALQWVELIKVYLHVKFERGIVNGHSAINLNTITNLTLKLGTFKVKVSQWVELIKVYLYEKFERGIVNGHSAINLNAITNLTLKLGTFKVKVTDKGHNGKNSSRSIYI